MKNLFVRFSNDDAQGRLGLPAGGLAQGKALAALIGESHPLVRVVRTASMRPSSRARLMRFAARPG